MPIHLFNLNINVVRLSVIYLLWVRERERETSKELCASWKTREKIEKKTLTRKNEKGERESPKWIKLWNYYCLNNNFMQLKHASISQLVLRVFRVQLYTKKKQQQQAACPSPCKFLYSFRCALLRCNEIWYALITIHSFTYSLVLYSIVKKEHCRCAYLHKITH